jgi:hypothetical protein
MLHFPPDYIDRALAVGIRSHPVEVYFAGAVPSFAVFPKDVPQLDAEELIGL